MPLPYFLGDRVRETAVVTGPGTAITLAGAVSGFQSFGHAGMADAQLGRVAVLDSVSGVWECRVASYSAGANALIYVSFISSSTGSQITFGGNVCDVYLDVPASSLVTRDNIASIVGGGGSGGSTLMLDVLNATALSGLPSIVGDGTTDDLAAITALFNWAAPRGIVLTASKSCTIGLSAQLVLPVYACFFAILTGRTYAAAVATQGVIFKMLSPTASTSVISTTGCAFLSGFSVQGNTIGAGISNNGGLSYYADLDLYLCGAGFDGGYANCQMNDIQVHDCFNGMIALVDCRATNITISGCSGNGIYLTSGCNFNAIVGSRVEFNDGYNLFMDSCSANTFSAMTLDRAGKTGLVIENCVGIMFDGITRRDGRLSAYDQANDTAVQLYNNTDVVLTIIASTGTNDDGGGWNSPSWFINGSGNSFCQIYLPNPNLAFNTALISPSASATPGWTFNNQIYSGPVLTMTFVTPPVAGTPVTVSGTYSGYGGSYAAKPLAFDFPVSSTAWSPYTSVVVSAPSGGAGTFTATGPTFTSPSAGSLAIRDNAIPGVTAFKKFSIGYPVNAPSLALASSPAYVSTGAFGKGLSNGYGGSASRITSSQSFTAECRYTHIASNPAPSAGGFMMAQTDLFQIGYAFSTGFAIFVYGDSSSYFVLTGTTDICDGSPHTIAGTVDLTPGTFLPTLKLWVDGVLQRTISGLSMAGTVFGYTTPFFVRTILATPSPGYQAAGTVDEVVLWTGVRYSANYTPLTVPYTGLESNQIMLAHLDGDGTTYT